MLSQQIEERDLKIIAKAREDLVFTFKLIEQPEGVNRKDSYALYIEIPAAQKEDYLRFALITQSKEIRIFKDLDLGKNYIQKIAPATQQFNVVIGDRPPLNFIERRKHYDRRQN